MPWIAGLAAATVLVGAIAGCAAPQRNPVPELRVNDAEVAGFEGVFIRFDGDETSPAMIDWLKQGIQRERARLAAEGVTEMPPANLLAISGGGSAGAYGAGVLCGWTDHGSRPEFRVVTGVSTGALIAPFAFVGPDYDHVLREVYTSVSTRDILTSRGLLGGLLSDGLADTAPLRALLAKYIDEAFLEKVAEQYRRGRHLIVATTNLDSQQPVMWALGSLAASGKPGSVELFRDVLIASASIPGVFPPVKIKVMIDGEEHEELHVDGGTTSQVFLYPGSFSVRDLARQAGLHRERTVYVIRNGSTKPDYQVVNRRTLPIAGRAIDTLIKTQGVGDLYRIYLGCKRDGMRFRLAAIPPDFREKSTEPFDPVFMQALFDLGYSRARAGYPWAEAPPGFLPPEIGGPPPEAGAPQGGAGTEGQHEASGQASGAVGQIGHAGIENRGPAATATTAGR